MSKKRKNAGVRRYLTLLIVLVLVATGILVAAVIKGGMNTEEPIDIVEDDTDKEKEDEKDPEPEPEPEPEIVEITLSAAGDCTLGNTQLQGYERSFIEVYDNQGPEYFFKGVLPVFSADDMTLVNFEGVLTEATDHPEKAFNMKGRPEFIKILPLSSIECVGFANNHRLDYYEKGANDTIELFKENNITYAVNDTYAIYEVKGIKIGYVAVNALNMSGVMDYLTNGYEYLKNEGCAVTIAFAHWGIEGDHISNSTQEDLAHKMIDMGYDLVLGAHPHVLQGVEIYNGKPIIYSMGNFCFGGNRNPSIKETMIYQQKFTFVDGVLQDGLDAWIIPCTLSSVSSKNDFQPTIRTGEEGDKILRMIESYSEKFKTKIDTDGHISRSE